MRTPRRVDVNQPEIVAFLRKMNAKVLILSDVGKGCPDILVGMHGKLALVEIKDGAKPLSAQKLTPCEQKFFEDWAGLPVYIVRNECDARNLIYRLRSPE